MTNHRSRKLNQEKLLKKTPKTSTYRHILFQLQKTKDNVKTFLKKILFIYFLRQKKGGEREGEKHQCVVASHVPLTEDLACNPGLCPDWELNW